MFIPPFIFEWPTIIRGTPIRDLILKGIYMEKLLTGNTIQWESADLWMKNLDRDHDHMRPAYDNNRKKCLNPMRPVFDNNHIKFLYPIWHTLYLVFRTSTAWSASRPLTIVTQSTSNTNYRKIEGKTGEETMILLRETTISSKKQDPPHISSHFSCPISYYTHPTGFSRRHRRYPHPVWFKII
jgi:hypothetical protein